MVRKAIALTMIVSLLVAGFGCASMKKTDNFNGLDLTAEGKQNVAHYNANCWGLYLLSIPLITGDPENLNVIDENKIQINMAFLTDTVNLSSVADMLSSEAKADGATILEDVNSSRKNLLMWFPLPIFFIRSVTVTANGVK